MSTDNDKLDAGPQQVKVACSVPSAVAMIVLHVMVSTGGPLFVAWSWSFLDGKDMKVLTIVVAGVCVGAFWWTLYQHVFWLTLRDGVICGRRCLGLSFCYRVDDVASARLEWLADYVWSYAYNIRFHSGARIVLMPESMTNWEAFIKSLEAAGVPVHGVAVDHVMSPGARQIRTQGIRGTLRLAVLSGILVLLILLIRR